MDEDTGPIRAALAYPLRGEAARSRLLVGGGVHFLAGVVLVGGTAVATQFETLVLVPLGLALVLLGLLAYVPLLGYAAAATRALLDDEPEPPGFGEWQPLVRDGLRFGTVVAAYAVPLVVLAAAAVFLTASGTDVGPAALAASAAAALYALAAAYVVPAALVTVVNEGDRAAAWDGETLRAAVVDRRYLGPWLVAAAVAVVGGGLGVALTPVVVGFAVLFGTQIAVVHAVTGGVIRSLDLTLEDPPPAPASGYVPGWEDGPRRKELSDGRLGGSLLPTTATGDDEGDAGTAGADQPTATASVGADEGTPGSTVLDRREDDDGPAVDPTAGSPTAGSASASGDGTGSSLAPFGGGEDDLDTADEDEE